MTCYTIFRKYVLCLTVSCFSSREVLKGCLHKKDRYIRVTFARNTLDYKKEKKMPTRSTSSKRGSRSRTGSRGTAGSSRSRSASSRRESGLRSFSTMPERRPSESRYEEDYQPRRGFSGRSREDYRESYYESDRERNRDRDMERPRSSSQYAGASRYDENEYQEPRRLRRSSQGRTPTSSYYDEDIESPRRRPYSSNLSSRGRQGQDWYEDEDLYDEEDFRDEDTMRAGEEDRDEDYDYDYDRDEDYRESRHYSR